MPNNINSGNLSCVYYATYNNILSTLINAFKLDQGTTLVDNTPELSYADAVCSDARSEIITQLTNANITFTELEIPE